MVQFFDSDKEGMKAPKSPEGSILNEVPELREVIDLMLAGKFPKGKTVKIDCRSVSMRRGATKPTSRGRQSIKYHLGRLKDQPPKRIPHAESYDVWARGGFVFISRA